MKRYNQLSKKELKEFAESYKSKHGFVEIMSVSDFNELETDKKKRIDKRNKKFNDDWYGIFTETDEMVILNLVPIMDNYNWRRFCWIKYGKNN